MQVRQALDTRDHMRTSRELNNAWDQRLVRSPDFNLFQRSMRQGSVETDHN